jgi:hypothetical protein
MDVTLVLPDGMWSAVQRHLLAQRATFEEAGFLFASTEGGSTAIELRAVEWYGIPPEGFEERSPYFLQLTDETKALVIKRAHDLQACLVEVHSHPFQSIAAFSPSDLFGFSEFVPHVRWRLKRRPYAAVVLAKRSFDALVWAGDATDARPLQAIIADDRQLYPTFATDTATRDFHDSRRSLPPQ